MHVLCYYSSPLGVNEVTTDTKKGPNLGGPHRHNNNIL